MSAGRFPPELLSRPAKERLAYFQSVVIRHPILDQVVARVLKEIGRAEPGFLVCVYGPPGVGKSTLCRIVLKALLTAASAAMQADPGLIPAAVTEVRKTEHGQFDWKQLYDRCLAALKDPFVMPEPSDDSATDVVVSHRHMTPRRDLRLAVEYGSYHRHVRAWLFDEAHHLAAVTASEDLSDQMERTKSFASTTKTVFVLFGTYALLPMTTYSGQLGRRTKDVHFPRYRPDVKEDVRNFKRILRDFQRELPLPKEPDLVAKYEQLYSYSCGLVGLLKTLLYNALELALEEGTNTITEEQLDRNAMPLKNRKTIAQDIRNGESQLVEKVGDQQEFEEILGIGRKAEGQAAPDSEAAKSTAKPTAPPFQRKPVRDMVGGG